MMQRCRQNTGLGTRNAKPAEPLDEGIQKQRRPQNFFAKKSDDELVGCVQGLVIGGEISGRAMLAKAHPGLYNTLLGRGLLDAAGLGRRIRNWGGMSREELVSSAKELIAELSISTRTGLANEDSGLYNALRRRGLLGRVGLGDSRGRRKRWADMYDCEVVAYAMEFIAKRGIGDRTEMIKAYPGMHHALLQRGLMGKVGLGKERRRWARMNDEELAAFAAMSIAERGITGRVGLKRADCGMYSALMKRGLLDRVCPDKTHVPPKRWRTMADAELVAFAKAFISDNGVATRLGLQKAHDGLYKALRSRRLLDEAGLGRATRRWSDMNDDELVALAKDFVLKNMVDGRKRLAMEDGGLYSALRKRNLLDAVFSDIESSKKRGDGAVLSAIKEALGEYSGDGG